MTVWRIGSNWGNEDILPIFKKHQIAFAGEEVRGYLQTVRPNDLIAVTSGQKIVAIGKAMGLVDLKDIDQGLKDKYEDVLAIKISPYYFSDEVKIDFGIYGGQGKQFHKAPNDNGYEDLIINNYKKIESRKMIESKIELLKYKSQIILQGPPGTGKTRMAKLLADELIKPVSRGKSIDLVNDFFKKFQPNTESIIQNRRIAEKLLSNFQDRFPIDEIQNLNLEDYCIGTGENNSFCWWIERGLKPLGYYSPGSSRSYLIYWSNKKGDYSLHGHGLFKNKDSQTAMQDITGILAKVVKGKSVQLGNEYFGDSFLLKVLNSYYPDDFFPINGERQLENALRIFGVDFSQLTREEKNKKLNDLFLEKKQEYNANVTSFEFSRFLFSQFNLKTGEDIDLNQVVMTNGEKQIIQFHPAYSYEDFVRGISVKTNEESQVEYTVENRILAKFAQKALDNPNGNYVLIIDEINRANLPSVLGELIYALEYRSEAVESMYALKSENDVSEGNTELVLPNNLYIIGTMNTADRSVGHIDYAIRRRFGFVNVPPSDSVIDEVITDPGVRQKAKGLYAAVTRLFEKENLASDFEAQDVQLGHSYFLVETQEQLKLKLDYEIKPILREYLKDGILLEGVKSKIEELYV